jgi:hypothetical protein
MIEIQVNKEEIPMQRIFAQSNRNKWTVQRSIILGREEQSGVLRFIKKSLVIFRNDFSQAIREHDGFFGKDVAIIG